MTSEAYLQIQNDMNAFQRTCVLAALAELDLSTLILKNGNRLPADSIAELSGCNIRGCTALLDCLAALGYLCKDGSDQDVTYSVANAYSEMLDSRHPATCIPIIRHMACVQRGWSQLSKAVRDGVPQKGEASILGVEEDRISFIMGMNSIAMQLKDSVLTKLCEAGILPLAKSDARILDVGGASGTYTEAFLEMMPEATAAIFDLPVGIAQARKRFASNGMDKRVQLAEGDFTRDLLPSGFDFAWVSAIIHQMDRHESQALYAKVHDALNPGGIIGVRDFVMSENRTEPIAGALFGINMLVNTTSGRVYTKKEIKQDLELSGFTDIHHVVDLKSMGDVIIAQKNVKNQ